MKRPALLLTLALASVLSLPSTSHARKPNIVFILADDLGYAELGCYGQKWIKTPHIDRLAAEGVKFTDHYSGQAVCAPCRCVLMTGKHPGHAAIRDNGDPGGPEAKVHPFPGQNPLPDEEVTIAEILKEQGYVTAAIGKWGLGHYGTSGAPDKQGFDLFFGYNCQRHAHNHFPKFLWRNGQMIPQPGNTRELDGAIHSQDAFTAEALTFVRENKDEPFFLYLPYAIPHLSIQTTNRWLDMYKDEIPEEDHEHRGYLKHPFPRAGYAAMVTMMDDSVGQVVGLIDELGLRDDTLIVFTSDNGPTYDRLGGSDSDFFASAGGLRGLKGSLYEGGIRVPMVARWPGEIKAGTVSGFPSAFWDWKPTLAAVAGAPAPEGVDGISLLAALKGDGDPPAREFLYWEFPGYGGQQVVRRGEWKAVRQNLRRTKPGAPIKTELYHLETDRAESNDVAAEHPEVVAELEAIMAREHTPNPKFPLLPGERRGK